MKWLPAFVMCVLGVLPVTGHTPGAQDANVRRIRADGHTPVVKLIRPGDDDDLRKLRQPLELLAGPDDIEKLDSVTVVNRLRDVAQALP